MQPETPTNPVNTIDPHIPLQQPNPPSSGKKRLFIIVGAIVLVLIAAIVMAVLMRSSKPATESQVSNGLSSSNNPNHIDGIAVNTFPYFSACKVYNDASTAFAGFAGDALFSSTYAETGLPARDIAKNGANGAIDSHCSSVFGKDTQFAGITVLFYMEQYPTEAAAKQAYDLYTPTQAQKDAASKALNANLPDLGYKPLDGVENTVYSEQNASSQTWYKNTIISFGATSLTGTVPQDIYQQAIRKAIPIVRDDMDLKNGKKLQDLQALPRQSLFGQKIGSSTHLNPCQFFTASDYSKATGMKPNPAEIDTEFNINVGKYFRLDPTSGLAVNSCTRNPYPKSAKQLQVATVELHYFNTASDAANYLDIVVGDSMHSVFPATAQEIKGVGDRAVYLKPTDSSRTVVDYYVLKGSYIMLLHLTLINTDSSVGVTNKSDARLPDGQKIADRQASGDGVNSRPTADQYKKLAQTLLPKLK